MLYYDDEFFEDLSHEEIKSIILDLIADYKEDVQKRAEMKEQDKREVWVKENLSNAQGRLIALENLCEDLGIELEE